jgi:hypothetical protein
MKARISPEDLKEQILIKFGSLDSFAKKAGMNNSQVSVGLKNQTARFMATVKRLGIKFDNLNAPDNKQLNDEQSLLKNCIDKVESLEQIVREKEQVIEHQNNLLKMLTQIIDDMKKNKK